jgi:hypothetical protein
MIYPAGIGPTGDKKKKKNRPEVNRNTRTKAELQRNSTKRMCTRKCEKYTTEDASQRDRAGDVAAGAIC